MSNFKEKAASKGYEPKDLEKEFEVEWRQMARIMANPKRIHWLALDGLPRKRKRAV